MASPKRPQGSIDQIFNRILLGSFLLHLAMYLVVMTVEPPPPPSQEEYASWLKKVTPPREIPEPEPEPEPEVVQEVPQDEPEEEVVEAKPSKTPPKAASRAKGAPAGDGAKRAAVRAQLSGAALLGVIGAASEDGSLANVFESGAVVSKDLDESLSERGGVRVSGTTRIGKKGALGAGTSADIGEFDAGAGGAVGEVGGSGKAGVVPQAFVKSTETILKKGAIDEKGVRLALKRRERGIQQCYERALKNNPKLKGKVVIEWGINEEGRVVKINIVQNTLGDAKVASCISDIIQRIRFPGATKGVAPVRKTFVFEAG